MKKLKVVRLKRMVKEYGYQGEHEESYQELRFGYDNHYEVIDTEIVPEHALIDLACFGQTQWRSKWASAFPELYLA